MQGVFYCIHEGEFGLSELSQFQFTANYFVLFDLPKSMAIDVKQLDERYKQLQRDYHPDKFVNASEQDRRLSMQVTSLVNQARQTLVNPLARATYLLELMGCDLNSETDTRMSGAFLMGQMELREALEMVDAANDPFEQIDELQDRVRGLLLKTREAFEAALIVDNLDIARERVREWQFLDKLKAEILETEGRLDDL